MKLFECQNCGQPLYFENTLVRELRPAARLSARARDRHGAGAGRRRLARARRARAALSPVRQRAARRLQLAGRGRSARSFLRRLPPQPHHPRSVEPDNLAHWRKIESAKHRLFYTLLRLRLPLATRTEDPSGLAFDFLSEPPGVRATPVMTGHDRRPDHPQSRRGRRFRARAPAQGAWANPIAPCSAISATRSRITTGTGWCAITPRSRSSAGCSATSGRTTRRAAALLRPGPAAELAEHFVTAYASAHPWEDFAETWAHYLHMVDTLETAGAFGLRLRPQVADARRSRRRRSISTRTSSTWRAHRRLAAADLRGQLDQPQHGPAGSLSVRSRPAGDREAHLRPRSVIQPAAQRAAASTPGKARCAPSSPG